MDRSGLGFVVLCCLETVCVCDELATDERARANGSFSTFGLFASFVFFGCTGDLVLSLVFFGDASTTSLRGSSGRALLGLRLGGTLPAIGGIGTGTM